MSSMKLGSIGEIPPSTRGRSGFSLRMARAAAITILANNFHSGSILKSQCDKLLGSFHSITASTIHAPAENHARTQSVPASSWSRMYFPSFVTRAGRQIHVSVSGWASISRPELRNTASIPPWLGIHQFVGSPAYFFSMKYMHGKSGFLKMLVFQKL